MLIKGGGRRSNRLIGVSAVAPAQLQFDDRLVSKEPKAAAHCGIDYEA
jgi:hypothetical protein